MKMQHTPPRAQGQGGALPSSGPMAPSRAAACETSSAVSGFLWRAVAFAIVLAAAVVLLCAAPSTALAKSYTMPQTNITATVNPDGSLHVVEERTFDFSGDFTAVWFTVEPPYNGKLKINGVSLSDANDVDQNGNVLSTPLKSVGFDLDWRTEGGPGTTCYSFDSPRNTVYVFFDVSDESRTVTLDYTVTEAVGAWKDVGELYWKYVAPGWAEDSDNVTMTVKLPTPAGTTVTAGENVRAWGHGPLDGNVAINADGSITYTVGKVASGQYAEARVVFPVEWMTALTTEQKALHQSSERLQTVLDEESKWADQANRARVQSLVFSIAIVAVAVLLVLWAFVSWLRHGKEHKPRFVEKYWRDVPERGVHPAEIGRLWRFDAPNANDMVATVMHLAHEGAIAVDRGSYPDPEDPSRRVEDYYLTKTPKAESLENPIDRETVKFLFDTVGEGEGQIWMGSLKFFAKKHPERYDNALDEWQGVLTGEVNKRDFFEAKGAALQMRFVLLGIVCGIAGVALWFFMDNILPLAVLLPAAVVTVFFGVYMPRRTQAGCDLNAKCQALHDWLEDFSAIDERPPTDVKVWGEFMVYAYVLGVAREAIKNLQEAVPEVFQETMAGSGYNGVPWWCWYSTASASDGTSVPSAGDFLSDSFSNASATAREAISAMSGGGSSGGGFGGGFSAGGGGGFGGGGGGGAR